MDVVTAEALGTTVMIFVGLSASLEGWLKTLGAAAGWAVAVLIAASIADHSGAHLNPAITVAQAIVVRIS